MGRGVGEEEKLNADRSPWEKKREAGQTQSQRELEEKEAMGLLLSNEKTWAEHPPPGWRFHSSYAPALPVFTRGAKSDFVLWSSLLLMDNSQEDCKSCGD